jgi:hypothetical protein
VELFSFFLSLFRFILDFNLHRTITPLEISKEAYKTLLNSNSKKCLPSLLPIPRSTNDHRSTLQIHSCAVAQSVT